MFRLGVCVNADNIAAAAEGGCEYAELGFGAVADMPEAEFRRVLSIAGDSPIGVEAMNVFIPGRFRITGPAADLKPLVPFLEGGFERARDLGVQVVVFGSSGARNMPEGFADKARAAAQCADFLRLAGPMAASAGIRVAIEPLSYREANLINTVAEAVELARMVGLPSVGVLADSYHVWYNKEGYGGIAAAGGLLWHCHVSHGNRGIPAPGDGEDYRAFFGALRAAGYRGRVSVEARAEDFAAQIGPAIAVLREASA